MLILGHVGITLAAIQIGEAAGNKWLPHRTGAILRFADYRIIAIGALLPDLIDKPLALLDLGSSRWIGHSLALALVLFVMGFVSLGRNRKILLLSLATGCLFHLIQDGMWSSPRILLWPAFGWFVSGRGHLGLSEYLSITWLRWWDPLWLFFEILGGLVIVKLLFQLRREGRLHYFFHSGQIRQRRGLKNPQSHP
jgi:hypothetical protein